MINSDECCIIEELRGRAFNEKGGEEEEGHARRVKRGEGGMFENREIMRPLCATLSRFSVFSTE